MTYLLVAAVTFVILIGAFVASLMKWSGQKIDVGALFSKTGRPRGKSSVRTDSASTLKMSRTPDMWTAGIDARRPGIIARHPAPDADKLIRPSKAGCVSDTA